MEGPPGDVRHFHSSYFRPGIKFHHNFHCFFCLFVVEFYSWENAGYWQIFSRHHQLACRTMQRRRKTTRTLTFGRQRAVDQVCISRYQLVSVVALCFHFQWFNVHCQFVLATAPPASLQTKHIPALVTVTMTFQRSYESMCVRVCVCGWLYMCVIVCGAAFACGSSVLQCVSCM